MKFMDFSFVLVHNVVNKKHSNYNIHLSSMWYFLFEL